MATKKTARSLNIAKIKGDYINLNTLSAIQDNGHSTLIYFQDRNDDNTPFIELKGMTPDQVMEEILKSLNGGESKIEDKPDTNKEELDDFLAEF